MPTSRKVIYSSYVVPIETETSEEGFVHNKLDTTANIKKFAGKGSVAINTDQATDAWTSFYHENLTWEMHDDAYDDWELVDIYWDNEPQSITNGSNTVLRTADSANIDFLYIKNTGTTNTVKLKLNDLDYDILISPGAAVSMRVNDIAANTIKVDTVSGTTTIEYVIAK